MSRAQPDKRWYWLLLLSWVAALSVPFYNRVEPTLFGFPFFYWYQLALVLFSSLITGVVYYLAHGRAASHNDRTP